MLSRILLAASLLAGVGATGAATRSTEGVTFEAPAGASWKEEAIQGGLLYTWAFANAENGRPASVMLLVTGSALFRGDLDAALVQLMDSAGMLVGASPTQSHKGTTTDGLPFVWAMRAGSVGENPSSEAVVAVVAMQRKLGLASAFMILVNVDGGNRDAADAAFDALVASMEMGNDKRPPLPLPQAGSQYLDGPYIYTVTSFAPNPMGGSTMRYDWKLRQFDPRGYYSDRLPLNGESIDALCIATPADCGTYRIDAGELTLNEVNRFGLVETRTKAMEPTERGFKVGGYPYEPARGVPVTTLNGSWRHNYFASGPGGSITSIRQIDFTADGRYKRTGFTGVTVDNPVAGISTTSAGTDPEQMGRYEIAGLTLKLTNDAGGTELMSLIATDQNDLSFLFIDGDSYSMVTD